MATKKLLLALCALLAASASFADPATSAQAKALKSGSAKSLATAAGTLTCRPGLCVTTQKPEPFGAAAGKNEGPQVSTHAIKLSTQDRSRTLSCDEGGSMDPACAIDDRHIAGEKFVVPGDGCLYVFQTYNAYFPVTKKYCAAPTEKLHRVLKKLYPVNIGSTAHKDIELHSTQALKSPAGVIPKGARYTIVKAAVDESDDFTTQASAYLVRRRDGVSAWASQESLDLGQCGPGKKPGICFQGD